MYSHFVVSTPFFTVVHGGVCSGSFTLYFISTCGSFSGIYCLSVLAYIWSFLGHNFVQQLTIYKETLECFKGAQGRELKLFMHACKQIKAKTSLRMSHCTISSDWRNEYSATEGQTAALLLLVTNFFSLVLSDTCGDFFLKAL